MLEDLLSIIYQTRGRVIGTLAGLLFGWLLITRGLTAALLVSIFVWVGYYLGRRYDQDKDLSGFFERILPPYQR